MRAVVIHKAKDLRVEEYQVDELGPGQVRIKMEAGGVCGSDLHYFNHGGFGTVRLREPMVLGHEVSGRIEALGEGVENLEIGELVSVSPSRPCGGCGYCEQGLPNHCENMRFYGSAMPFPHIQGAFREVLVANASQCVKADGLTAGEAAMAEPLSVCLHAVRRAGEMLGKRVLITGCGPIGLLTILVARRAGATEIVATDLSENALTYAKAAGADRVINVLEEPDALSEYEAGKGTFDVMFEASGANVALNAAILTMRPRGIVMQLGMGGDMTVPMQQVTVKELDLRGCFRFHEEFHTAVALMQKGLIDVKPLITHTMALEDALAAFEIANDRSQAIKAQISFS
ncbi:MAG: L-idonate 5-dehydrogenase [Rhizobiaceae bacterium]|nr:L-idonate 5-dehydrogenase [Rhizobiaceae bacterium]